MVELAGFEPASEAQIGIASTAIVYGSSLLSTEQP